MRKQALSLGLVVALFAGMAWAQEASEAKEEAQPEPRHTIKVLQHPYDIASFYRSSQERPAYFGLEDNYAIASYYRGRTNPRGYSRFWTNGYSARRPGVVFVYRNRIGQNRDLYLLAPTFLAPVGPLMDAYFGER